MESKSSAAGEQASPATATAGATAAAAAPPGTDGTITAATAVWVGLACLAAAMGIGRFSFTPMLPLMQQDAGLSLAAGGWLASANYLGYLIGALICINAAPAPVRAIRWGLVTIGASTLAMGLIHAFIPWALLRLIAGAASAFVLVGVSAWALPLLGQLKQSHKAGGVFAGVGSGICLAGVVGLLAGIGNWGSTVTWLVLGVLATLAVALVWVPLAPRGPAPAVWPGAASLGVPAAAPAGAAPAGPARPPRAPLGRAAWIAAACYGAFGYGYIIPATFLPAQARSYIGDPAVFGWVWPLFGIAAALSTVLVSRLTPRYPQRAIWAASQWVMAAGVIAPVFTVNGFTLVLAALAVGGTFMVATMAGTQEARRLGGAQGPRLIALNTAAFAAGQIAGPLTVSLFPAGAHALFWPSVIAALVLVASSLVLSMTARDAVTPP